MMLMRLVLALQLLLMVDFAAAQAPLKVGLVVPQSGALKNAGGDIVFATNAWAAEKNSNGGLRGRKVDIRVYDDESSRDGAQRAAARAIAEGVELFLNCFGTVACMQVARQAQAASLALVGPIAGAETLRGPHRSASKLHSSATRKAHRSTASRWCTTPRAGPCAALSISRWFRKRGKSAVSRRPRT